jgi:hypothetical protein
MSISTNPGTAHLTSHKNLFCTLALPHALVIASLLNGGRTNSCIEIADVLRRLRARAGGLEQKSGNLPAPYREQHEWTLSGFFLTGLDSRVKRALQSTVLGVGNNEICWRESLLSSLSL